LSADCALGVYHRVLMSPLVGNVRLEILNGAGKGRHYVVSLLSRGRNASQHHYKKEKSFHICNF